MPTPESNPTELRPDQAATPNQDQNASGKPGAGATPESTQENMGDGAGIRGNYGDASQTNGLEGGPDETETDTELTGS